MADTLVDESMQDVNVVTLEMTVPTGFEFVAMEEVKERFGELTKVVIERGRIYFNMNRQNIRAIHEFRSVDHVYILIRRARLNLVNTDSDTAMTFLKEVVVYEDVCKALSVWSTISDFKGIIYPTIEQHSAGREAENELKSVARTIAEDRLAEEIVQEHRDGKRVHVLDRRQLNAYQEEAFQEIDKRLPEEKVLRFRLTCDRNGKHSFASEEAARHVGGTLQDLFNWIVDLRFYDIEFVLNIKQDLVYFGLALTKESKHNRNITAFGPTTLRATICYNLLRLGKPKPGDIIVDPLCGGGSIPLEGLSGYPQCFYMCGDFHEMATSRLDVNISSLNLGGVNTSHIDGFAWDSTHLPLKDESVDIFVTDLPFGKRSGRVSDNRTLYRKVLVELARVVKCRTGQAVLLTGDKKSMSIALNYCTMLWTPKLKLKVNVGGLEANVYVLIRKSTPASSTPPTSSKSKYVRSRESSSTPPTSSKSKYVRSRESSSTPPTSSKSKKKQIASINTKTVKNGDSTRRSYLCFVLY